MILSVGVADLVAALRRHELWRVLALYQLKRGNARTKFGIAWHGLSFFILVGLMGFMYATFMHRPLDLYVPYLAAGQLGWRFISPMITEGLTVITGGRGLLTQRPFPISFLPLKLACYHLYLSGLHAIAFIAILAIYRIIVVPNPLLLAIGLVIVTVAGVGTALLLGIASVFHRWLQNLIPSLMNLAFFLTPIIWMPNMLVGGDANHLSVDLTHGFTGRSTFVLLNPFYYFLEVVRGPLLGYQVPFIFWFVASSIAAALMICGLLILSRTKPRIILNL